MPGAGSNPTMPSLTDQAGPVRPPERRFGLRALVASVALVLVAVPFGLLFFLVQAEWGPLARADAGARDDLHAYAVEHAPS